MAISGSDTVRLTGLDELRKELKKLDGEWIGELKAANYEIAADIVVPTAKSKASGTRAGSAVVSSIRAARAAKSATVSLGGARVPWAAGWEFGALKYKQFPRWKGNGDGAGYFLWPTIRERRSEIIERYMTLLEKITSRAFPD
jgi:hypothetical protein